MNKQIKEEKNCFLRDYSLQKEVEKLDLSEKIRAQLNLANIRILLPKKDISKKNNRFNVFVSEAFPVSTEAVHPVKQQDIPNNRAHPSAINL